MQELLVVSKLPTRAERSNRFSKPQPRVSLMKMAIPTIAMSRCCLAPSQPKTFSKLVYLNLRYRQSETSIKERARLTLDDGNTNHRHVMHCLAPSSKTKDLLKTSFQVRQSPVLGRLTYVMYVHLKWVT